VIVFHVAVVTVDDYVARREPYRKAHLERLIALRDRGMCIAGGPSPDGRSADIFYRVDQPEHVARLVEEDPYFTGGVWRGYERRSFGQFVEPWEPAPVVTDGSRAATLVEGLVDDVEMASFVLIEARGAGRMVFGGFFPGGESLALMREADGAAAVASLEATGFWRAGSLRGRPYLHVL
jgi:uncharacterized protein YciI